MFKNSLIDTNFLTVPGTEFTQRQLLAFTECLNQSFSNFLAVIHSKTHLISQLTIGKMLSIQTHVIDTFIKIKQKCHKCFLILKKQNLFDIFYCFHLEKKMAITYFINSKPTSEVMPCNLKSIGLNSGSYVVQVKSIFRLAKETNLLIMILRAS